MNKTFFDNLITGIRHEYTAHPGQDFDPAVLQALMSERPKKANISQKKADSLEQLCSNVRQCDSCPLAKTRHNVVFGEGNVHAELMFIGEGPGNEEDMQGRPFVGEAGQLLTKMIQAMQFTREEVYIANIVKCRPPNNRVPSPDEIAACINYLKAQIQFIAPQVIVLLGATAVNALLGCNEGITRLRGKWLEFEGIKVMPTFHPAYLLRQKSAKRQVWEDLQQVMKVFDRVYRS
ncbi:MAG: uracil-DNA glycosylase [Victivallales bacterium]|nr:uracil-DNA glycosylase [Victivallales bacterium]